MFSDLPCAAICFLIYLVRMYSGLVCGNMSVSSAISFALACNFKIIVNVVSLSIHLSNRMFRMFFGLPDPDKNPLVRGTDPDPAPDPSLF
jgi:hypothetical protein